MVKKNRGVVGSIVDVNMVGRGENLKSLVDHVTYVHENFGPDILSIGTDYFGLLRGVAGLENVTKLGALFDALRRRGMSEEDLGKFAHDNAMRVIKTNAERWR